LAEGGWLRRAYKRNPDLTDLSETSEETRGAGAERRELRFGRGDAADTSNGMAASDGGAIIGPYAWYTERE
jgi:hypothetical protein